MEATEKCWGVSQRLALTDNVQVERIIVVAGGYSSIHKHHNKHNAFIVEEGTLAVHEWLGDAHGESDECIIHELVRGQGVTIDAGVWHQFLSRSGCVCAEYYSSSSQNDTEKIKPDDIERETAGGVITMFTLQQIDAMPHGGNCCRCNWQFENDNAGGVVIVDNAARMMCEQCIAATGLDQKTNVRVTS